MAVHGCQMTGREELRTCYRMVTRNGARTLHLHQDYGIAVGRVANLIGLHTHDAITAIRDRAIIGTVISRGRCLATTTPPQSTWYGPPQGFAETAPPSFG
jgi:cytosine deaminase